MSELVGSLAGILSGFSLDRLYTANKDRMSRKKLKENLKQELWNCMPLLNEKGNLLPKITWDSSIASGDIGLLSFYDRFKLSNVYFMIDNYNYEAKRVRDSAVIAQTGDRSTIVDGMPKVEAYWRQLSLNLMQEELKLKTLIARLLEDDLWKK